MQFRKLSLLVAGASLCCLATPAYAGEAFVSDGKLFVKTEIPNASNFTLSVTGPHGFNGYGKSPRRVPSVALGDEKGISDGLYSWQLSGSSGQQIRNPKSSFNNGREKETPMFVSQKFTETGTFQIIKGVAQMPDDKEEKESDGGGK